MERGTKMHELFKARGVNACCFAHFAIKMSIKRTVALVITFVLRKTGCFTSRRLIRATTRAIRPGLLQIFRMADHPNYDPNDRE